MNFFPDQLTTARLGFDDPDNVLDVQVDGEAQVTTIRCVVGPAKGYEARLYYNGRLLIGFQERCAGVNEKLDFVWEHGRATATDGAGREHALECDGKFHPIIWRITGTNAVGDEVVLRYTRNFFDELGVLYKSIRYEEGELECRHIYQYFHYGLDDQHWKARRAWIYRHVHPIGDEEYWASEVPVDLVAFPDQFQTRSMEVLQQR